MAVSTRDEIKGLRALVQRQNAQIEELHAQVAAAEEKRKQVQVLVRKCRMAASYQNLQDARRLLAQIDEMVR